MPTALNFQRLLGERVKARRRELGFTQHQLAESIGKSRSALANIETGTQRSSTLLLAKLARALATSPGALMPSLEEAENRVAKKIPFSAKTRPELLDKALREYNKTLDLNLDPASALEEIRQSSHPSSNTPRQPR